MKYTLEKLADGRVIRAIVIEKFTMDCETLLDWMCGKCYQYLPKTISFMGNDVEVGKVPKSQCPVAKWLEYYNYPYIRFGIKNGKLWGLELSQLKGYENLRKHDEVIWVKIPKFAEDMLLMEINK